MSEEQPTHADETLAGQPPGAAPGLQGDGAEQASPLLIGLELLLCRRHCVVPIPVILRLRCDRASLKQDLKWSM